MASHYNRFKPMVYKSTPTSIDHLRTLLADIPQASIKQQGELPVLHLAHALFNAQIAVQGAQLLTFQPHNDDAWLWLSPTASWIKGKAIRGGIPLCLPWFGVNRYQPDLPKHGVARHQDWQLRDITSNADGITLHWRLAHTADALFAHDFIADLQMQLSDRIQLTLTLTHQGESAAPYSLALHSYLMADARTASIEGLANTTYLDNTQQLTPTEQTGAVRFAGEVDRVYMTTDTPQVLHQGNGKQLHFDGQGCPTCIVWNPGQSLASTMADVGDGWQNYVCVERGAAFDDEKTLQPGQILTVIHTIARD